MSSIKIDDNNDIKINNILIDESIFNEEKVNYRIVEREGLIEDLCRWIAETKSDSDKTLMLEDLKTLVNKTDEFCFSSIMTNEYVFPDDDEFENICKEILELNPTKLKVRDITEEINLYGCMHDFKEVAFSEFLKHNGFKIIDDEEEYADFEYSDCKAYLDLEIERL